MHSTRSLTLPENIAPVTPPAGFVERCIALGIAFDGDELQQFGLYLALLNAANEVMNLTTVTQPDAAWEKHILDSLTLLPLLASADVQRVVDVGSGGGVPGIPLAVSMPDVEFALVESTGKKARFLELVVDRLGLNNVTVVAQRAEDVGRDRQAHRDTFDAAIVRAVGHLAIVLELCVPLVKVNGFVLAVKGAMAGKEIAMAGEALRMLHAEVSYTVPTPTGTVVVVEKLRPTPKLYPRKPGEPKRAPLGMPAKR